MAMNGAGAGAAYNPRTVEEVFRDFKGRRTGLIKALTTVNMHISKIIIETDSAILVNLIQSDNHDLHPLGTILNNCKSLMRSFEQSKIQHIHRERNMVADLLAKNSTCNASGVYTFVDPPPFVIEALLDDITGTSRVRLVRSSSADAEDFHQQCDPEKENLSLYGFPSEHWEVNLPAEEVPPELPEPALGINFARDGMAEKDWLALVSVHSDAWLLSVAFYFGSRFGFDKNDRKKLFSMINELPTIFEVVTGTAKKEVKEKPSSNHGSNKSKSNSKARGSESQARHLEVLPAKDEDEGLDEDEEDEHEEETCGACGRGGPSSLDEPWILCDFCETWYHMKCVKVTPAKAKQIKQYKCPSCSNKRARPM